MLTNLLQLVAGFATVFLPGAVVLTLLGVRARVVLAGLSAPLTAGLVLVTAIVTGVAGLPFGLGTFGAVVVLAAVLATGVRAVAVRRSVGAVSVHAAEVAAEVAAPMVSRDRARRAVLTGKGLIAARALGLLTGFGGAGTALLTWWRGLGSWSTPAQEHDPVTHSVITAYIRYSGNAAPWETRPLNVVTGEVVAYYPSGLPRLAALVSEAVGDPMTALNVVTVVLLAVAWPVSAAALAVAGIRLAGFGKGWTELGAGIAALLAAVLYRPAIGLAHDGGVLPNAAAMVAVPGLVAVLLLIGRKQWPLAVALGVSCAGVLSVHPSAAVSAALTLLAAWAGLVCTASGRARLRASFPPLLATSAVAALAALPILVEGLSRGGSVSAAPATIEATPLGQALTNTVALTYLGYFDPSGALRQLSLAAVAVAGVIAVGVLRRGLPLLTVYLFWVGVSLTFQLSPNSGFGAAVAGFFYNSFTRLQAHVSLVIPALAAGAFVGTAAALMRVRLPGPARRTDRAGGAGSHPLVALASVAGVLGVLGVQSLAGYATMNAKALAMRYQDRQFVRYDSADLAAMRWLDTRVEPGETILNNANDGSTLAYVRYELPILSVVPSGTGRTPGVTRLLADFHDYPSHARVRAILLEKNVRWIYVDARAPTIGARPQAWHGQREYTFAPGLRNLEGLPGLFPAFTAEHVTVYELDLEHVGAM